MAENVYNVYFDARDYIISNWNEYYCDMDDLAAEKEMVNDIKYALREAGGGEAWIYDSEGEMVNHFTISARSTAIYQIDDKVSFLLDGEKYIGIIAIVDAFGTFFDNSEPYYDIYIERQEQKILVKHVPQSSIRRVK